MNRATMILAAAAMALLAPLSPVAAQGDAFAPAPVRADDPALVAAADEAQRTLPGFLEVLVVPPPGAGEFAIRFALNGWEHIWVDDLRLDDDRIVGRLANAPVQGGYRIGQSISVPLALVNDWAWRDGAGVMHGHRSTRVLLARLDPAEARAVSAYLGWSR